MGQTEVTRRIYWLNAPNLVQTQHIACRTLPIRLVLTAVQVFTSFHDGDVSWGDGVQADSACQIVGQVNIIID